MRQLAFLPLSLGRPIWFWVHFLENASRSIEVFIFTTWVMLGNAGLSNLLASLELGPGSWELGAGYCELLVKMISKLIFN